MMSRRGGLKTGWVIALHEEEDGTCCDKVHYETDVAFLVTFAALWVKC